MESTTTTTKTTNQSLCYCCDGVVKGIAFRWVGGRPVSKLACARHAWDERFWPTKAGR